MVGSAHHPAGTPVRHSLLLKQIDGDRHRLAHNQRQPDSSSARIQVAPAEAGQSPKEFSQGETGQHKEGSLPADDTAEGRNRLSNNATDIQQLRNPMQSRELGCHKSERLRTRREDSPQIRFSNAEDSGFQHVDPERSSFRPSPRRGIVLITTGLLAQLEENEIISVLGHEFGHLKGHDPLALFGLTGAEFLFRFYVLLPFFPIVFTSLLFIVYFWVAMTLIYFIAKFFEARADLTSAIVVGQPQVLAEALEKIGFKRLLYERVPSYRIQEWISLDPHPPMYFRIHRLRKLGETTNVKHPLFQSAREVTRGFLDSL